MTNCEIAGQFRLECLFSPRIHGIYDQAQKSPILYRFYSYYIGAVLRAHQSVLHRPVDAGHTVLDVTIGRRCDRSSILSSRGRRPESENLPRMGPWNGMSNSDGNTLLPVRAVPVIISPVKPD